MSEPNSDPWEHLSAVDAELTKLEEWIGIASAALLLPTLATYAVLI